MGLCLVGHHLILSEGEYPKRLGLKRPFALLCPRSPSLAPWSHRSYLLVDSLVSRCWGPSLGPWPLGRCQKIGGGRRYCTHISSIRVCCWKRTCLNVNPWVNLRCLPNPGG